jgi:phage gpG-like protein
MAFSKDEMSFTFEPDLPDDITSEEKRRVLDEIGDYLVTEILSYVGDGNSPVSGKGKFKQLSKAYADAQKLGDRKPILELDGDMLEALTYKIAKGKLVVGIFDDEQAIKAYGHNTGMEGHPWLDGVTPVRQFIPKENEKLKKNITDYVQTIIEDVLGERED